MTAAIRYVQNTMDGGANTPAIGSTGTDSQLVAIDVTTTAGIAATANADVLKWTGSGKIKSIVSVFMRRNVAPNNTGEVIPMGAVAQNTHTTITLDDTGKIINIALLGTATPIPANTTISFLLVIGKY
jgi:hypothetical protein